MNGFLPPATLDELEREILHSVECAKWLLENPMPWDTEDDRLENQNLFHDAARRLGEIMMAIEDAKNKEI